MTLKRREPCSSGCLAAPLADLSCLHPTRRRGQRVTNRAAACVQVLQKAICPERRKGIDSAASAIASVTEVRISSDLQVRRRIVPMSPPPKPKLTWTSPHQRTQPHCCCCSPSAANLEHVEAKWPTAHSRICLEPPDHCACSRWPRCTCLSSATRRARPPPWTSSPSWRGEGQCCLNMISVGIPYAH